MPRPALMRVLRAAAIALGLVAVAFGAETVAPARATIPSPIDGAPIHTASPAPAMPRPSGTPHPMSLTILSVEPQKPAAGQPVVVTYVVRNLAAGTVLAHLSATIAGGFPQTLGPKPTVDTAFAGNQQVTGTFPVSGGPAGSDMIELTLSTTPCGGGVSTNPACAPIVFAQASTTVVFTAPPTERLRTDGFSYANIHHDDPHDGTLTADGYLFVVHDPGCSSNFSSGNHGNDTFFENAPLPAGATVKAVDFTMYAAVPSVQQQYYGGVGGYGSYGLKLVRDGGNGVHVHWENACHGKFASVPVVYSISFELDVQPGVTLRDNSYVPTDHPTPPSSVNYTTLGVVGASTNAAAASMPGPVPIILQNNGENMVTTFAPPLAGTISAITNQQAHTITLIADKRLGDGCGPSGNVVLVQNQTTTPDQMVALFGSATVHTPRTITACAPPNPSSSQPLEYMSLILTFLRDCLC